MRSPGRACPAPTQRLCRGEPCLARLKRNQTGVAPAPARPPAVSMAACLHALAERGHGVRFLQEARNEVVLGTEPGTRLRNSRWRPRSAAPAGWSRNRARVSWSRPYAGHARNRGSPDRGADPPPGPRGPPGRHRPRKHRIAQVFPARPPPWCAQSPRRRPPGCGLAPPSATSAARFGERPRGPRLRRRNHHRERAPPRPALLSTFNAPLCARTMPATEASPKPRPAGLVVKKGSKMRALVGSSMPHPVSRTSRRTCAPGRSPARPIPPRWPAHRDPSPWCGSKSARAQFADGLRGVDHQVHDHLLHLGRIDFNGRQARL